MSQPIADLVACAHRKCRHLTTGSRCGLLLAGQPILLNARGQCEMMEEDSIHLKQDAEPNTACSRYHCRYDAMSRCAIRNASICAHHRGWVPNGGIGPGGELLHTAYCDICLLRHVRHIAGADLGFPSDPPMRDDRDDPDDPWQPV